MARRSSLDLLRTALADRYDVEAQIGRGGAARVFRATDRANSHTVAIKVLRSGVSFRIARERFLQEIALISRLDHPHLVPILDTGEVEGLPYFVMPFIAGGSLRDEIGRTGPLDLHRALLVCGQAADAVAYAHSQGVIHRDLKPDNILEGEHGVVVVDFGFARALYRAGDARLTQAGEVMGTPTYMSPEQALGKWRLDETSDVYSLGCVTFEALTGEPPFRPARPDAIVVRRLNDPVPSVADRRAEVPKSLDALLASALAWNPAQRPSAEAFRRALATAVRPDDS